MFSQLQHKLWRENRVSEFIVLCSSCQLSEFWFFKVLLDFCAEKYNAGIHKLGPKGRNCFLQATISPYYSTDERYGILRYLHSVDENLCKGKTEDGYTALTLASEFGSKEIVELLIEEFNADINELGSEGRNCFLCAASGGKLDTMNYLHSKDENLWKEKDHGGQGYDSSRTPMLSQGRNSMPTYLSYLPLNRPKIPKIFKILRVFTDFPINTYCLIEFFG